MTRDSFPAWLRRLASLKLTTALLLLVFAEVLWGTVVQTRDGLWASQRLVFENWWGGIPFLCGLGAINLVAAFVVRFRWSWRNAGLLVAHIGLLALILSGALGLALSRSSSIDLGPGEVAAGGRVTGHWEVVQVRHDSTGGQTATVSIDGIAQGQVLDFGAGRGRAVVAGFTASGTIGVDQLPISLPRGKDPADRVPAIALDWTPEGGAPQRVALDGNRPMAAGGAGTMFLLQNKVHPMPFQLRLRSFKRELHPGSMRPKAFESRVEVMENGGAREAVIRMNHPLRVGRFTVYQSSWRTDEETGVERTILSVVENPTAGFPYYATLLIGLGLAVHFLSRIRWRAPAKALPVLALLALASTARAAAPDLPAVPPSLAALPIQVDGRIKSFETFARHTLLQFSGRSTVQGLEATRWMAAVVLEPSQVADLPVFLVENPDVRDALGLQGKERDRYSWTQFRACGATLEAQAERAAMKNAQDRSAVERELLRLSDGWIRYEGLQGALSFLRPGSVAPLAGGKAPVDRFFDLARHSDRFALQLDSLVNIPPETRSAADSALLGWFRQTFEGARAWDAAAFPVVPLKDSATWTSPAARLRDVGMGDSGFRRTLLDWDALRDAWKVRDGARAEAAAASLRDSALAHGGPAMRPSALEAEAVYNRLKPVETGMWLFLLAVVPALLGAWKEKRWALRLADASSLIGLAMLLAGMGLRMAITRRPPVTNLYETFLFVAAVAVPALLVGRWWRGWLAGSVLASLSGFFLLLLARGFGADGDTMPVLVAVLDSNFWLTVHVLTITIGYGGVVAGGLAAHWHLMGLRSGRREGGDVVRGLLAFGLFFTFVGTLLGGVWADQSWGRFWGWDPKENGALLIVLWVAALFHARSAGMIGTKGFSVGGVLSISTVVFAWFGVNLLGVGLHSYGFTEGTLWGLAAFALFEAAFLAWFARPFRGQAN